MAPQCEGQLGPSTGNRWTLQRWKRTPMGNGGALKERSKGGTLVVLLDRHQLEKKKRPLRIESSAWPGRADDGGVNAGGGG